MVYYHEIIIQYSAFKRLESFHDMCTLHLSLKMEMMNYSYFTLVMYYYKFSTTTCTAREQCSVRVQCITENVVFEE